jgi:hypothetical protein
VDTNVGKEAVVFKVELTAKFEKRKKENAYCNAEFVMMKQACYKLF